MGKELFLQFIVRVFRERLSVCMCPSFPFDFEGYLWELIVSVPDQCLSFFSGRCGNLSEARAIFLL